MRDFSLRARTAVTGRDLVRRSLDERMRDLHVPAVSVAVLDEAGSIECEAFGAASERSRFQAASISKPIAAMATMALRVELDTDVNDMLDGEWRVPDGGGVTVRRLLSHMAGLGVHGFPGYEVGTAIPSLEQILDGVPPANTEAVRVVRPPGEAAQYSGGGFTVLQLLLEQRSGRRFADVVRDAVLTPLGMVDSGYEQPAAERAVAGHDRSGTEIPGRWRIHPEQAAAGLWTTPTDLLRAVSEMVEPRAVLDRHQRDEMLTPVVDDRPGLGWLPDGDWFGHGGSNAGYRCKVVGSVAAGVGMAVMTNGDAASPLLIGETLAGIADAYGWTSYLRHLDALDLDGQGKAPIVGSYEVAPGVELEITDAGRDLHVHMPGTFDAPVYATGDGQLFVAGLEARCRLVGDELVIDLGPSQLRCRRRA